MSDQFPSIDISTKEWAIIENRLKKHVSNYEVWAFGSRAKCSAKPYSDLDLCLISHEPIPLSIVSALRDDFSESDLPWKVDIVDWSLLDEAFRQIITQDKVVLQTPRS